MPSSAPGPKGALRLFTAFGIDVYVHWSWALIAVLELQWRKDAYGSMAFNVLEYLTLFAVVLMHEFGHALACRSVGGQALHILLWPLGGVAYVRPPNRPGAQLWSLAAGPLVNLVLAPVAAAGAFAWAVFAPEALPDVAYYLTTVAVLNVVLFLFNMLPVYPLDGGQILRSVLWFFLGPVRSLKIATVIGMVGAVVGVGVALVLGDFFLGAIAAFAALRSWRALQAAQRADAINRAPRHAGYHCPSCGEAPAAMPLAHCPCGAQFDWFANLGTCPACKSTFEAAPCSYCGRVATLAQFSLGDGAPEDEEPGG